MRARIATRGKGARRLIIETDLPAVRHPCDVCCRVHQGRCSPDDTRSVQLHLTVPTRIRRRLYARVPWGQRAGWVARLIERELDRLDAEERAA